MSDRRATRRGSVALLAGMIAALVLGPAAAASASLGSVPAQVAAYVADGGMLARLTDVYGKNGAGVGIDFDATTKAGPISRVYEWTAARLSSPTTDHPVQLTNNWVVPITIADKPVGLATLWINPQTVAPELAEFTAAPALATAMASVPAAAALVRDTTTHAWFALAEGTVTPLVAGTSGLSTPAPVASLKLAAESAPVSAREPNTGLGLAIGAVAVVVVVIAVALLWPRRRRPMTQSGPEAVVAAKPEPVVEPDAAPAADVEATPAPTTPKPRAPRSAAARPSSPVTKPVGSKPGSRTPTSAAASTKPRTQKPPAQKPPTRKPPAQKPPTQKPPTRKPPTPPVDPDA
jgi:hypothetical protein